MDRQEFPKKVPGVEIPLWESRPESLPTNFCTFFDDVLRLSFRSSSPTTPSSIPDRRHPCRDLPSTAR